jgi:hypothetical protein
METYSLLLTSFTLVISVYLMLWIRKNYFGENLHIPEITNNEDEMQFFTDFSQALTKAEVRP